MIYHQILVFNLKIASAAFLKASINQYSIQIIIFIGVVLVVHIRFIFFLIIISNYVVVVFFPLQDSNSDCTCHIFIDESEYRFAPQLVEIIENAGGTPSKELIDIAQNRDQVVICNIFKNKQNILKYVCKQKCSFLFNKNKKQKECQLIGFS